jgi:hypothetical protein
MKKIMIFAAVAALTFTSCVGDLDQSPLSDTSITSSEIYSNPTYRMGQLAKIYGGFTLVGQNGPGSADIAVDDAGESEFLRAMWSIQEISTDAAKCVWGNQWNIEMDKDSWTTTKNSAIYATYTRAMMMITFANDFIRNTSDDDAEVATERTEVRFLRAYAYWVLLDCFGNPPFVDENTPIGAYQPKQISSKDLFTYIEKELTAITADGSAMKEAHTQVYPRVDKGAAYGLLARLYINHKTYLGTDDKAYYTKAMEAASKVIAAYKLADNYAALFMGDNGENPDALKEIVYASCYDASKTQSYGGPTYIIAAGKNEPNSLGLNASWSGLVTSTEYANFFGINTSAAKEGGDNPEFLQVDKRALLSLKYSESKDMVGDSDFPKGWHVIKFNNNHFLDPATDYATKESFASIDFPMIRAAEMYLIYAEAKTRIDGGNTSDANAVKYINDLRKRAGRVDANATSISLNDVFTEISRELMWEGQRRTILIRFDKFTSGTYLWRLKGGVKNGQALPEYRKLFPLPSDDVLANSNLKQNAGYTE